MKINKTINAEFFYGATPVIFQKARELRKKMTVAEKVLWDKINDRQMNGLQFRRQHPINKFIADFYCHKIRLVIEVDGRVHDTDEQMQRDKGRNYFMSELGLKVLRFSNDEVIKETQKVVDAIMEHCR